MHHEWMNHFKIIVFETIHFETANGFKIFFQKFRKYLVSTGVTVTISTAVHS